MAVFEEVTQRSPSYKIEVFNLLYAWYNAGGTISPTANQYKSGWYEVPQGNTGVDNIVGIERLKIKDDMTKKSTAEFDVLADELWMYTCDMILKRNIYSESPFSSSDVIQNPNDSKLILYIDDDGFSGIEDTVGTIDVVGELDSVVVSDNIEINGTGSYVTDHTYDTITSITMNDLTCHLSIFAHVNDANIKHEVRISCDTNGDGNYGLMFGGYLTPVTKKVMSVYDIVTIKCVDYTDFFMSNEYIAGYRSNHRCEHYSNTGETGDCALKSSGGTTPNGASERWHTVATGDYKCYIGDMEVRNPDGTLVDATYRCVDYSDDSGTTEHLPYDGYTYDEDYTPDTETEYSYYPKDYTRALYAIKQMANSIDMDVKSREYDLHMKCSALANEAIDSSETLIDFDDKFPISTGSTTFETNDFIRIDDEWMIVVSNSSSTTSGTLTVARGKLGSVATSHSDNTTIKCYSFANTTYASSSHDYMIEPDIGGTIYNTGDKLAELLTSRISDSYFQFWIDAYKQIHMTEMYRTDASYSGSLTFTIDDISKVSGINVGNVVNKVSAWVDTGTTGKFYCELTSDDVTGITGSIEEFGLHSEEVKNDQLNIIGYDDLDNDKFGFLTYAEAYLKTHAYPIITQTLTVDSFVPDEHYWEHLYDPTLVYNDGFNEYVCLLGTRCIAPDFSIEGHPNKTFIIEALEYNIKEFGNFDTKVRMSRLSTASDY